MESTLGRASVTATRKSAPLFGQHGVRRVVESARTERMCDFLRANVKPGAIAKAAGVKPARVYEQIERKVRLTSDVERAGISLLKPGALLSLPESSHLLTRLTTAAGTALREGATFFETVALAEGDGRIDGGEAGAIRFEAERIVRLLGSIVLTAETAAGMRLS